MSSLSSVSPLSSSPLSSSFAPCLQSSSLNMYSSPLVLLTHVPAYGDEETASAGRSTRTPINIYSHGDEDAASAARPAMRRTNMYSHGDEAAASDARSTMKPINSCSHGDEDAAGTYGDANQHAQWISLYIISRVIVVHTTLRWGRVHLCKGGPVMAGMCPGANKCASYGPGRSSTHAGRQQHG